MSYEAHPAGRMWDDRHRAAGKRALTRGVRVRRDEATRGRKVDPGHREGRTEHLGATVIVRISRPRHASDCVRLHQTASDCFRLPRLPRL